MERKFRSPTFGSCRVDASCSISKILPETVDIGMKRRKHMQPDADKSLSTWIPGAGALPRALPEISQFSTPCDCIRKLIVVFCAGEDDIKSSGFWAKNPVSQTTVLIFPPFTLPLVVLGQLGIFPPEKWFVFPAENSLKKCSASWL